MRNGSDMRFVLMNPKPRNSKSNPSMRQLGSHTIGILKRTIIRT